MTKCLEIERKYVLDLDRMAEIRSNLLTLNAKTILIRQCYTKEGKDWLRYRQAGDEIVLEQKDSVNIDAPYSISRERSMPISAAVFHNVWKKSKKRLTKLRYTTDRLPNRDLEEFGDGHTLVVDFFFDDVKRDGNMYAAVAEVETIIDGTTKWVDLNFRMPKSLRQFVLWEVDRKDPRAKTFSSINMCEGEKSVATVIAAIKALR